MGDLVNFPTWVFEKEKELNELERNLAIERYAIEREKYRLRAEKSTTKGRALIALSVGIIVGLSLGMIALAI